MALYWCRKCGRKSASKVPDVNGWDGSCSNCGAIGQADVLDAPAHEGGRTESDITRANARALLSDLPGRRHLSKNEASTRGTSEKTEKRENREALDRAAANHKARVEKEALDIVDSTRARLGRGWSLVGEQLQHALIAQEIVRRMLIDENDGSLSTWTWIAREAYKALDGSR